MTKKRKIAIFLGHPRSQSFCGALAENYAEAAKKAGHDVRLFKTGDMNFDPIANPRDETLPTEADLRDAQEALRWAEHLVFVYPTWWFSWPARLKGFVDRLLRSGLAFRYHAGSPLPEQLLRGRSARLIVTSDGPALYYALMGGNPAVRSMRMTLKFCGIKPVRSMTCGSVLNAKPEKRQNWLDQAAAWGRKGE